MASGNSNVLGNSHVVLDGVAAAAAAVALAGSEVEVDDSSVIVLSYLVE